MSKKFISRGQGCEEEPIQLGLESLAGNEYIGWEKGNQVALEKTECKKPQGMSSIVVDRGM